MVDPGARRKIDAIPGRPNHTWFEVAKTGTYRGQCAELCGLEHANMLASVKVMRPGAFDQWLTAEKAAQTEGTSTLGKQEWTGICAKCHGFAGEGGIAVPIAGSSILTDPRAIENLIRNGTSTPQGTMPPVASGWTQEQVDALTKYLKESPPSGS